MNKNGFEDINQKVNNSKKHHKIIITLIIIASTIVFAVSINKFKTKNTDDQSNINSTTTDSNSIRKPLTQEEIERACKAECQSNP